MSKLHLSYKEYKQLVADDGVTNWVRYNWLSGPENPFFGGFKRIQLKDITFTHTTSGNRHLFYAYGLTDFKSVAVGESIHGILRGYTKSIRGQSVGNLNFGIDSAGNFLICNNAYDTVEKFIAAEGDKYLIYELQPQYTELQYIQSNGVQYIDTGYNPNNRSGMKCDFSIDESVSDNFILGVKQSGDTRFTITRTGSALYCGFGIATPGNRPSVTTGTRVTIENNFLNDRKQKLNGTSFYDIDFELPQLTRAVATCGGYRGDIVVYYSETWYNFQLSEGTEVIMNLIPVRRNTDNAVGMYDRISGQFFGNSGTGVFIAGPEKEIR